MTWETVYNATLEVDPATDPIIVGPEFQPYYRLIVSADLLTGLGVREPFLGNLRQLLLVPGIGEVKGRSMALAPSQQLLIPSTEFPYRLVYQPVRKDFSLELSIQVESTIVSAGGTADNGPVLTAISAVQTSLDNWTGGGEATDYAPLFAQVLSALAAMDQEQNSMTIQVATLIGGQADLDDALADLHATDSTLTTKVDAILAAVTLFNQTLSNQTLTFASTGDTNGVFYWLGTFYGGHAWVNPQELQVVTTTMSSNGGNFPLGLPTNRQGGAVFCTGNAPSQWIAFDLGSSNALQPNRYALRHDNEVGYYLRSWKLQGCNDVAANTVQALGTATWTDLKAHVNDATLNSADAWGHWAIEGVTTGYRWLRILMTGADANGSNYLCLGEVEFFGSCTHSL